MTEFMTFLDASLIRQNSDYSAKRSGGLAIERPFGHNLRPGVFDAWLKSKGKLGGQHKIPRLSNERTLLDEVLAFDHNTSSLEERSILKV